jgi:cysteine dioxygenase
MKKKLSIDDIIDRLRQDHSGPWNGPRLLELLEILEVPDFEMFRYASFRERGYARNIVYRDEMFEILMICWKNGQRSLIHDHGRSLGAVKILQGVLTESLFAVAPNGMIKPTSSEDYQTGEIQLETESTIHQVSNLQPLSLPTISLHIYTPPLEQMNIYQLYNSTVTSAASELYNSGSGI